MAERGAPTPLNRRPRLLAWVVLLSALTFTGLATWSTARAVQARERLRFQNSVRRTEDILRNRLDVYVNLLRGGAAYFTASDEVSRAEFGTYVRRLEVTRRYPGIQGIGFSARVEPDAAGPLTRRMRREGAAGFRIWPDVAQPERHAILYLEPLDRRNQAAIGYDMFSEPTRRAAMERARDTGAAAASGKVTLVQEIDADKQPGFLIYVPVYRGRGIPTTVAGRRAALHGFVYSPFRAADLFRGIFGSEQKPRVDFRIYDGSEPRTENLLHTSQPAQVAVHNSSLFSATERLQVAGRPWTVHYTSSASFDAAAASSVVPVTLTSGVVISLLLFVVTRSQVQARERAEQGALVLQRSEAEAREQREQWRITLASIGDAVIATDPEGKVTFVNAVAEAYTGWSASEAQGKPVQEVFFALHAETRQRVTSPVEEILARGGVVGLGNHTVLVGRDGRERPIEDSGAPVRDDAGVLKGVVLAFRDVSERTRLERRRTLEHRVAQVLSEARTWEETAPGVLRAIGEELGFLWAIFWQVEPEARVLRYGEGWYRRASDTEELEAHHRHITFQWEEGLPGRAWAGKTPVRVPDVAHEPVSYPAPDGQAWSAGAGIAIPLGLSGEVIGVLEFRGLPEQAPDDATTDLLVSLGNQLGLFAERSRAEEARRATEALKAAIIHTAIDCIITIDAEGRIIEWNPAAERTFGYPREEAVGQRLSSLIIPNRLRERHEQGLSRYLATGVGPALGRLLEFPALRADGSEFAAEISIVAIQGTNSPCFTAFLRDITARKQAEETLQLQARVLESMAEGVSVADANGMILYTNAAEDAIFGYAEGELIGCHVGILNAYPPEENQRIIGEVLDHLRVYGAWSGEWRNRRKDGGIFTTHSRITALDVGDQRLLVCVQEDVTERKRTEESLHYLMDHAQCLLWHAFVEAPTAPGEPYRWDLQIFDEQAAQRFLPLDLLPGESYAEAFYRNKPPEDRQLVDRNARAAFESGSSSYIQEYRCLRRDGEVCWLSEVTHLERIAPDRWRSVGVCTDITLRKRLEEALRQRAEDLTIADRQKDEFLAMLGHELRSPLGAMVNALHLLRRRSEEPAVLRSAAVLERQLALVTRLVGDLQVVSRLKTGSFQVEKRPLDLTEVLNQAVETSRPLIEERRHQLTVALPPEMPPLCGDFTRLVQVFSNLLNNAAKYTEPGGRIQLEAICQPTEIEVRVRDSGLGIPPEQLPKVFDLFMQSERTLRRADTGLGIGLALVRGLVEMHGGAVSAHSGGPGQGSEFIVRLPRP